MKEARKLICLCSYIVDLSRWAVLALVGSAPESLYRQLADFLLNYILSRPSLGVHFSVCKYPIASDSLTNSDS